MAGAALSRGYEGVGAGAALRGLVGAIREGWGRASSSVDGWQSAPVVVALILIDVPL